MYRIGVELKQESCHQCQTLCRTRQGDMQAAHACIHTGLMRPATVPVHPDFRKHAVAMLNIIARACYIMR